LRKLQRSSSLSSPPATTAAAMASQHPAHGKDDLSHEIRL
jgi:hypothetical protein